MDNGSGGETAELLASHPLAVRACAATDAAPPPRATSAGARRRASSSASSTTMPRRPGLGSALLDAHRQTPTPSSPGRTEPHPAEARAAGRVLALQVDHAASTGTTRPATSRTRARCSSGWAASTSPSPSRGRGHGPRLARARGGRSGPLRRRRARVARRPRRRLARLVRRARWRLDVARLINRHPGLRHHYYGGVFWKRAHAQLAAASPAPRWRGPRAAPRSRSRLPYVRLYRDHHGSYAGTVATCRRTRRWTAPRSPRSRRQRSGADARHLRRARALSRRRRRPWPPSSPAGSRPRAGERGRRPSRRTVAARASRGRARTRGTCRRAAR